MQTRQINTELPLKLVRRFKKDAVELDVTLNDYVSLAIRKFCELPIEQRRIELRNVKRKILGRRISA